MVVEMLKIIKRMLEPFSRSHIEFLLKLTLQHTKNIITITNNLDAQQKLNEATGKRFDMIENRLNIKSNPLKNSSEKIEK